MLQELIELIQGSPHHHELTFQSLQPLQGIGALLFEKAAPKTKLFKLQHQPANILLSLGQNRAARAQGIFMTVLGFDNAQLIQIGYIHPFRNGYLNAFPTGRAGDFKASRPIIDHQAFAAMATFKENVALADLHRLFLPLFHDAPSPGNHIGFSTPLAPLLKSL